MRTGKAVEVTASALHATLTSPNEADRNGESANVVDGLFAIARSINRLAEAVESLDEHIEHVNCGR